MWFAPADGPGTPVKDLVNRRRHGLSLGDGIAVLDQDALAVSRPDPHPVGEGWQTMGNAWGVMVLFVVHADPQRKGHGTGRIISVRKATRNERKACEDGAF